MNKRIGKSGLSIVEMLIAVGIFSIVTMALISFLGHQNKEVKSIDEKLGLQGIQTSITNVLSNPTACGCFMGAHTFDYTASTWNSFPTSIGYSYDAGCAPVAAPILTVGTQNQSYLPTSMTLRDIAEVSVGSGSFSAKLTIDFDANAMTRSRKAISIPFFFKVRMADPPATRSLESCSTSTPNTLGDPVPFQINVPRNGTNSFSTLPDQFKFCFLTSVQTGGNDGGGNDRCEVDFDNITRVWTLSGQRGNDPAIICKMYCILP